MASGTIFIFAWTLFVVWLLDRLVYKKRRSPLAVLPGPESDHWLFGNLKATNGPESTQYIEHLAQTYGGIVKIHGFAGTPYQLLISDPEASHSIFVANTDAWPKPALSNSVNNVIFGPGVATVGREAHRRQRKTLTPIFSTQQIRGFLPSFYEVSRSLCKKIKADMESLGDNDMTVDILRLMSITALDIVGTSAIGYNFDTIHTDSEYSKAVKKLFATLSDLGPFIILSPLLAKLGPWSFRKWAMDHILPHFGKLGEAAMRYRRIIDVMNEKSWQIYTEKQNESEENREDVGGRKDVISGLRSRASTEDALEEIEIVSQIQTMVFAGHETTSTALTRALQILSQDTAMQDKLRREFDQARMTNGDEDLDYDAILALPFLDAFVREVLRMYPPLILMAREASKDTILPFHTPVKTATGQEIRQIAIPKGTFVVVGINSTNKSEVIYGENAREFQPERWLSSPTGGGDTGSLESGAAGPKSGMKNASMYSGMLTFSGGFRSCLGFKFAVLEIKVVLYSLLNAFAFSSVHPDEDITWKTAVGLFPVIRGQEGKGPQLPLKVTAL